ncbi:DUF2164 domain-containing protein, partial [Rhizobium leguminosarum]|uniref:DUF2164 domain-containing protein n=1 Tax=Rhizobium leguminosarum TaxID=384 RepID=UPI003F9DE9DD
MKKIEFSKEAKATIVARIRRYFDAELDKPIGALSAEFLLDFFADEIGAHYYNQGIRDEHAALLRKMEDLAEDIYLLERDD